MENDELKWCDYVFFHVVDQCEILGLNMDDVVEQYELGNVSVHEIEMLANKVWNLNKKESG